LAWALITLVRAELVGWYPYFFFNLTGLWGWSGVSAYVAGITVFYCLVVAGAVGINRVHANGSPDSSAGQRSGKRR
jgi:hypothetical protein